MRMNLTVDIGNTAAKYTVYRAGKPVALYRTGEPCTMILDDIFSSWPIEAAILSSTRGDHGLLEQALGERTRYFLRFGHEVPVPLRNDYATPETLGCDRLAAAVGASVLVPRSDVLIVDFGTALTYDLVTADGAFAGGAIAPGLGMRFRALHDYTACLPLLVPEEKDPVLIGRSTREAICGGVVNGIVLETEGYEARLRKRYPEMKVIFTGGDAEYFVKRFKFAIFANYDLVSCGLNRILEYNADRNKTY